MSATKRPSGKAPAPKAAAGAPQSKEDQAVAAEFKRMMDTKVGGGKSAWSMTLETIGMAEGKQTQTDIITDDLQKAMGFMKTMVMKLKKAQPDDPRWKFSLIPLKQFPGNTMEDVLRAFVMWSRKDGETTYNVSKSFRRLQAYATWMEEHRADLTEPLTVNSIRKAAEAWQLKITHDKMGRIVWWLDINQMDLPAIKNEIPTRDSLRFVVWQSHMVMLDRKAQENGIIIVESMGEKGLIETFTMVPMDLGTQMDRLTIGVLPLRAKAIYVYNHRRWMSVLMAIMSPFLSAKMRQRIIVIPRNQNPAQRIEEAVGKAAIPVGFANLDGKAKEDIVFGKYLKKRSSVRKGESEA